MEIEKFASEKSEDLKKWGLENPVAEITVFEKPVPGAKERSQKILLGRKDVKGGHCYLKRGEESFYAQAEPAGLTFLLSKENLKDLQGKIASLKKPTEEENPSEQK